MKTLLASTLILGLAAPATAQDFAAAMGDFLDQHVVGWAADPVLLDAIRDQNAAHEWIEQSRIDALDRAWQDEIGRSVTPTISTVMENPASDFLRARVNALRHFLHQFDYPEKDPQVVFAPDPKIVRRGKDAVGD